MTRPTPEEIVDQTSMWDIRDLGASVVLDNLKAFGYVIEHRDDRQARDRRIIRAAWVNGAQDPGEFWREGNPGFDPDACPYQTIMERADQP